jgi:hypothetical protein
MTSRSRWTGALAALLAATLAGAATAQEPSTYAVEVIVFANTGDAAYEAELWRLDPGAPDLSGAVSVSEEFGVPPVSPAAYRLAGIWRALRASPAYQPLRHLAWQQPAETTRGAPEVLVGEEPDAPVRGVVQVTRGRYLHARVDLVYYDELGGPYRLEGRRRMRSNELHYLDHPLFGVLVVVTPVEE